MVLIVDGNSDHDCARIKENRLFTKGETIRYVTALDLIKYQFLERKIINSDLVNGIRILV